MTLDDYYTLPGEDKVQKNECAWKTLFEQEKVLDIIDSEGEYNIDAATMKKITKREPRLMAKIESKYTLPSIMYQNNLCILPHKARGNYIIGRFDAFTNVDYTDAQEISVCIDRQYDLLNPFAITKEPSLILSAFNFNVLREIANDEQVFFTNFGRENTGTFEFDINDLSGGKPHHITVDRSQLEMDGVFESDSYIINIEAKMGLRQDFLTRQLYYPFRMIQNKTDKDIINLFLSYSAGSMYLHTYETKNIESYNSFIMTGSYKCNFFEEVSVQEAIKIIYNAKIDDEPDDVPFPQADSMGKVFDALGIIKKHPGITDAELAYELGVAERQGGYYGNSCRYLRLTERVRKRAFENYLSPEGEIFLQLPIQAQIRKMIELLSKHKIFNYFLKEYIEQSDPPKKIEIAQWIRENVLSLDPEKNTPDRRAQTVEKWIEWVFDSCTSD